MAGIREIICNFAGVGRMVMAHEEEADYTADLSGIKNVAGRRDGQGNIIQEPIITPKFIELPQIVNDDTQKTYDFAVKCIGKRGTVTVVTTTGQTIVMNQALIVDAVELSVKTGNFKLRVEGNASSGII